MESGSETGTGGGPGRRGRLFDDLAGLAGGAFSMVSGLRAEVEAMARSQVELMVQRLELVRREDLDAALEVARRAREESTALATRVAALEAKLAVQAAHDPVSGVAGAEAALDAALSGAADEASSFTGPTATSLGAKPAGTEPTEAATPPLHAGGPRLADEAADKGGEGEQPLGTGTNPTRPAEPPHPAKPL